jgi:hypothetical protein
VATTTDAPRPAATITASTPDGMTTAPMPPTAPTSPAVPTLPVVPTRSGAPTRIAATSSATTHARWHAITRTCATCNASVAN